MRQWLQNLFAQKTSRPRRPSRFRPTLEPLGERLAPATFNVVNLNDAGDGSLRKAIADANARFGDDTITFQPGLTGTITLTSGQLSVTDALSIQGPGAQVLTVSGNQASRIIDVDDGESGRSIAVAISGLRLTAGHETEGDGGAIRNNEDLTLVNCTLAGNQGRGGGGLFSSGTATLTYCTISGNSAPAGGGIAIAGTATLTHCTLAGNSASSSGGGIAIAIGGAATLTHCTLAGNSAISGGGIANQGTARLTNCTLAGNSAFDGGGIYNNDTATLTHCTLSNNSAVHHGGGIRSSGTMTLNNTIVANSDADHDVLSFSTLSGSHNLIESGTIGDLPDTITDDPRLGPLQDNGGPTQTMALLPGSPALNQGSNALAVDANGNLLTSDQRGAPFVRIADGAVDIGASERQTLSGLSLVVDTLVDESDGVYSPGDLSLREAGGLANSSIGANVITFDPMVFATHSTITLALGELVIGDDLNITGPAAGVTLDAGNASRIFTIDDGTAAAIGVALTGLTLTRGRAEDGGAILNQEDLSLTACTLEGNAADRFGGAIFNRGTATLTGCTVLGNSATRIGGGFFNFGTATLTECTLAGNTSIEGGSGLYNAGTATLTHSTLAGNASQSAGGGLYNVGTATLTGCTLSGNSAPHGGGLFNFGTATLIGCTLSGNSASQNSAGASRDGGGIGNVVGTLTLTGCTLSGNSANRGGGIFDVGGTVALNNTIVANSPSGGDIVHTGALSGSHNLIEDGSGGLADTVSGDPGLGPLQDNGGPTWTHALFPGSPALNQGSNALAVDGSGNPLTTDQRGPDFDRVRNRTVDIGAFELQTPLMITSAAATTFTVGTAGGYNMTTDAFPPAALTTADLLPEGVTFTDNGDGTATFAGTPTPGSGGTYVLTVTASKGNAPDVTQTFTLTIEEAPTIASADATAFTVGTASTFVITTGHAFPAVTTLRVSGTLPSGVTFTDYGDGTATLAGTPAPGSGGTYILTVTASNGVPLDAVQSLTLTVHGPRAALLGVRVQNGEQQRSLLTVLDLFFSNPVSASPGAIRLRRVVGGAVPMRSRFLTVNGRTVVRLTFQTSHLNRAALGNGRYRLTIDGSKVFDAVGHPLGGLSKLRFYRLYGDVNGNGQLGPHDRGRLRQVLRRADRWQSWSPLFGPVTLQDLDRLLTQADRLSD